jgi:6-phosphogluconolactonase
MHHELESLPDPEAVAGRAASFATERAHEAIADRGRFHFAVSGGHTPWAMFAGLARSAIAWEYVVLSQVDERVAPSGDPDRNLTHLRQSLRNAPAEVAAMAVDRSDLEEAAAQCAALPPDRFDLVHLGLGPDGHYASLVPGDPVLEITDRLAGVTASTQGHRRMTLTYPALGRADQLLWPVTGTYKQDALRRLLVGDETIPAGRAQAGASLVMADRAAS